MGRKIDKDSMRSAKTINFESWVLRKLERQAEDESTTVTNLVNSMCRRLMISDVKYARFRAKNAYMDFQKWKYVGDQIEITKELVR